MTLLGILLALALERALGHYRGWGRPILFLGYLDIFQRVLSLRALWTSWLAPIILLVPPVAGIYYVHSVISSPFLELLLSAAVLLLCLGPRDLAEDIHSLLDARARGDTHAANHLSRALMRGPQPDASRRTLIGALFIQSHERLFGVLFWFFACGSTGAVLYRLISRLPRALNEIAPDSSAARFAETLHDILAWVPGRATALLYGLAGSLDDALVAWRELGFTAGREWRTGTWAVLATIPAASLNIEEADGSTVAPTTLDANLSEVLKMQARALLILLAFFAIFTTGVLMQ